MVGSARRRVGKVMSMLPLFSNKREEDSCQFEIEFVPCVATFDSYENEQGYQTRYLMSVNYHGPGGLDKKGSSLAPFFDESAAVVAANAKKKQKSITGTVYKPDDLGILGAVFGVGIEEEEDVESLRQFFQALQGVPPISGRNNIKSNEDAGKETLSSSSSFCIETVNPNTEYSTMKDENEAFRSMSAEEKEIAAKNGCIGPGKMAKFAHFVALKWIRSILEQEQHEEEHMRLVELEQERQSQVAKHEANTAKLNSLPTRVDTTKEQFACRKCRTVLFGQNDQEDPPHVPAKHKFSARKLHHGATSSSTLCQSFFLSPHADLQWLGDTSALEGRIACPKCTTKLGTWHWAGAQCSCGTWVAPALQIPKSKLDVINPVLL